jgi:hypothetical protein
MTTTPLRSRSTLRHPTDHRYRLFAGATAGNERLTTVTGLALIVLFAALGVTIIRIGQLLWLHLFLGLLLIGPVALKLASTGYRFVRYYTGDAAYQRKGPPPAALRALAPVLVTLTLGVFASGVVLLIAGPASRQPLVLIHKVFFIAWIAFVAIHMLGHLPEILRLLRTARTARGEIIALRSRPRVPVPDRRVRRALPGGEGRAAALVAGLAVGLVIALGLLSRYGVWTAGPGPHH